MKEKDTFEVIKESLKKKLEIEFYNLQSKANYFWKLIESQNYDFSIT